MKRMLVALLLITAFVAPPEQQASAHASLAIATPGVGKVINKSPKIVRLTFDEDLISLGKANQIKVTNSKGALVSLANTTVNLSTASVQLKKGLVYGTYTVTYRIVSADGHIVSSKYKFYYRKKS
jgi:methionine-rich copper-binding protein CopC